MALEPVRLDDLTWEGMVLAIRRRIAAASGQEWTLHAAVDPGVTLLELYAWLLEQRVYWMDQVSPSFIRAAMGLIGESTRATQSATTVLKFRLEKTDPSVSIPRSTQMRLGKQPGIIFSTQASITALPIEDIGLSVGVKDVSPDLKYGRLIPLFESGQDEAEIKITFWLRDQIASSTNPFSLFFDLDTSGRIAKQWSQTSARNVSPPAPVKFLYRQTAGQAPIAFPWVHDGTGGLRRSGLVRFRIPDDWKAEGPAVNGLLPYSILLRSESKKFTSSPLLRRLIPNAAIARHRVRIKQKELSIEWLPLPGNEIALAEVFGSDYVDQQALEPDVALRLRERDGEWHRWSAVNDLAFHGPADRVFVIDRERGALRFGDGETGRLPVPFAAWKENEERKNVRVCLYAGGGGAGNIGNYLEWESVVSGLRATNIVRAEGGTESETTAAASERAGAALRKITRAVTARDHEEIALTTPGIAIRRAHAAVGYHPEHPCQRVPGAITVFVVPDAPRPTDAIGDEDDDAIINRVIVRSPIPDEGALAAIRARFGDMRLVASEVFVIAPRYRPVGLEVFVEGDPHDPAAFRQRINDRLQNFLDPLVGGDKKQGWPFGEPLRPSVLLRETQRAIGETGDVTAVSIKLLDDNAEKSDCRDVAIGDHELVVLKQMSVRLTRSAASAIGQGGLR